MFDETPTVPEHTPSFLTMVPFRARRPETTSEPLPIGVRAIGRDDFQARCQYAPPNTTPIAWFEASDGATLGLVLRDHSTTSFVAVTFRRDVHRFVPDQRLSALDERPAAISQLLELLDTSIG